MPDLTEQIIQAVTDPASASVDGLSVTATDPLKVKTIDQYLAAKAAASKRRFGIRLSKVINPGALSESEADNSFNNAGNL